MDEIFVLSRKPFNKDILPIYSYTVDDTNTYNRCNYKVASTRDIFTKLALSPMHKGEYIQEIYLQNRAWDVVHVLLHIFILFHFHFHSLIYSKQKQCSSGKRSSKLISISLHSWCWQVSTIGKTYVYTGKVIWSSKTRKKLPNLESKLWSCLKERP